MQFEIRPPKEHDDDESLISVFDKTGFMRIFIKDGFGDEAVIYLEEPQRSEFIRRIAELKQEGE